MLICWKCAKSLEIDNRWSLGIGYVSNNFLATVSIATLVRLSFWSLTCDCHWCQPHLWLYCLCRYWIWVLTRFLGLLTASYSRGELYCMQIWCPWEFFSLLEGRELFPALQTWVRHLMNVSYPTWSCSSKPQQQNLVFGSHLNVIAGEIWRLDPFPYIGWFFPDTYWSSLLVGILAFNLPLR